MVWFLDKFFEMVLKLGKWRYRGCVCDDVWWCEGVVGWVMKVERYGVNGRIWVKDEVICIFLFLLIVVVIYCVYIFVKVVLKWMKICFVSGGLRVVFVMVLSSFVDDSFWIMVEILDGRSCMVVVFCRSDYCCCEMLIVVMIVCFFVDLCVCMVVMSFYMKVC